MTTRLLGWAAAAMAVAAAASAEDKPRLNVLFIAVDDLRPELGCYGVSRVKSPNIDALAARGLVFNRAYCQQAVCSPSRTSLLTGRRPDTTKVYDLETHFRKTIPDVVTLPQHFQAHGYVTRGVGKIYHGGLDDPKSWSAPHEMPNAPGFGPEGQALLKKLTAEAKKAGLDLKDRKNQPRGLPYEAPEVSDDQLQDGAIAGRAVALLGELKDKPFFLAVGFLKPHLPFVAPRKYWDLYDPAKIDLADNPYAPKGAPRYAATNWSELRQYHGMPKDPAPMPEAEARKLVHGYLASVSYVDAQVGRVLAELDRLGLRDNTVVILWGDHGWQLGEHGFWCKHTNYEVAARAALLMSAPGRKAAGARTDALVEFVDIYPTLTELCGLPKPDGLEGISFAPMLDDPSRAWKPAVFHQYPRGIPKLGRGMGHAIRTDRHRLVEWTVPGKDFREYELYDLQSDPAENENIAGRPDNAELVKSLAERLHAGWKAAAPK